MRHARPEDLARLAPLLARLRKLEGLVEKAPGAFYRRGKAFLHFHEHEGALFADLKDAADWRRFPAAAAKDQTALVEAVRKACAQAR